jgi:hypothetical protein
MIDMSKNGIRGHKINRVVRKRQRRKYYVVQADNLGR